MTYRTGAVLAVLLMLAALAPVGVAAQDSFVEITSPQEGARVSRSATPTLEVTGRIQTFDVPESATRTFYLRRGDCRHEADRPEDRDWTLSLRLTSGNDAEGCPDGVEPAGPGPYSLWKSVFAQPYFRVPFPALEGVPLTLDVEGTVTGTLMVGPYPDYEEVQAGAARALISLQTEYCGCAVPDDDDEKLIGQFGHEYEVQPGGGDTTIPFEFDVVDDVRQDLDDLVLRVRVDGRNVGHGSVRFSGRSYINIPILTRRVDVSFDDPGFGRDRTVQAVVAQDGSWSASVDVPGVLGTRTIYVALRDENGQAIATASVDIVVTP